MGHDDGPVDLDLRVVRYFLEVVEQRHFGRAAAQLYIGQPSLSRSIRQLEQRIGVVLLDRTPLGAQLTPAGEAFLPWARELVAGATRGISAARDAARPRRIVVGYTTNLVITAALRELRGRHPDADVDTHHLAWDEPRAALLEHRVDAVVTRLPLPTDDLAVTALHEEPRVLMVSLTHRLAGRTSATLDEIADDPLPVFPDPEWNAFWRIDPRPDGRPAPSGPAVTTNEDNNEWVATGCAVSFIPIGAVPNWVHPGCTTVEIVGVEPCRVVVVTRAGDDSALVSAFVDAARATLTSP